jgi:hypothetical protein
MTNDIISMIISTVILWACIYALCCALLPRKEKNKQ